MKFRTLLSLAVAAAAMIFATDAAAQKKDSNPKKWEWAQARQILPEVRTFVTPQICDMQMLSKGRETFGPYYFNIESGIDNTFMSAIKNYQMRALYRACQEADADAVIEPVFDSYVYEKDQKVLVVELQGYPVKYVNFRPATQNEVNMIGTVYPAAFQTVDK